MNKNDFNFRLIGMNHIQNFWNGSHATSTIVT